MYQSFTLTVDGADIPVSPAEDGAFSVEATITGLGDHTLELVAVDNAGLRQVASVPVTAATQPDRPPAVQRLLVVDRYRMATFSCGYAVGDPLKTITLTPGESATYSVKSYEKDDTTLASSSSILDSTSQTAKSDFEDTLSQEQSSKSTSDESLKWHVDAKASANWGVASAQIDGGVAGGTSAAREELAKNVSNAVAKHAAEKSAQRQLDIKTSRESKQETDTENATESKVSNINLSCSLNVVFSAAAHAVRDAAVPHRRPGGVTSVATTSSTATATSSGGSPAANTRSPSSTGCWRRSSRPVTSRLSARPCSRCWPRCSTTRTSSG